MMFRKTIVAGLAIIAALAILAMARPAAASGGFFYGFEENLKPWVPGLDNAAKNYSFQRTVGENGCYDLRGNAYANLKYSPSDAASAAWIAADFVGTGSDEVDLSFNAKNTGACQGCKPVLYVGAQAPVKAAQFVDPSPPPPTDTVGISQFAALSGPNKGIIPNGWKTYHYATGVAGAKTIYVALGMSGSATAPKVVETASIGLDCVYLTIKSNATTH